MSKYVVQIAAAIAEAIATFGDNGVPSGHLYAISCANTLTADEYQAVIRGLIGAGLIEESNHVLRAVGALAAMKLGK